MSLLEVKDVHVSFDTQEGWGSALKLRAVDGVSLRVERGESVGLVGESGCGKSTLGNAILGLVKTASGEILCEGRDIRTMRGADLKRFRQSWQMIFQDPFGSLNPRLSVGGAIMEVLAVHHIVPRAERRARAAHLLELVGLEASHMDRYPHEFSGGQRQRIGIARALALNPALIVADEPVSALDVSVQAQILNLMKRLQREMGLAYLFIAHDLAVVRYMCDRVLVMYLGKIVESGTASDLFERTSHPYTEALLSAVPDVDKGLRSRVEGSSRIVLKGDVPTATQIPPGCRFHPRCHRAEPVCRERVPPELEVSPGHVSACHFAERLFASSAGGTTSTAQG